MEAKILAGTGVSFNPLKHSGVRWSHLEVFSAIQPPGPGPATGGELDAACIQFDLGGGTIPP